MIDLIITGVIDGPLPGGVPKAVELYVVNDIADLDSYGLGSANNGEGSDGQEYTFSGSARAGDYLYIASETAGFTSFFGFAPTDTAATVNINGDDAIELFYNGSVVDVFGEPDTDSSSQPWEYTDGWAYRQTGAIADGTFNRSQWRFSQPGALSEPVANGASVMPFPLGSFTAMPIAQTSPDQTASPNSPPDNADPAISPLAQASEAGIIPLHQIQGDSASSPLLGQTVTVEAVVVGDFQGETGLRGFYLQEEDSQTDSNPATSEGLFVFDERFGAEVSVGDLVRVGGRVEERFDALTALGNVTAIEVLGTAPLPTAATLELPLTAATALEAIEGMRVTIPTTLYVTEYFNLDRFGEIRLAADGPGNVAGTDGRIDQFTQFNRPNAAEFAAYQQAIASRQILLDDGSTRQNPPQLFGRGGQPLSAANPLRGGDTVTGLTGVLSFDFGQWRIQTTGGIDFQPTNPRPAVPPEVGGSLKLASLNVLNFFTTLNVPGSGGSGPTGQPPRGANTAAEFERQLEKLVTTLSILDADIVGLVELENEFADNNGDGKFAIATLVKALNARLGSDTYAYVDPAQPFVDTGDAISVGALYKPATVRVAPGTQVEILTDADLPALAIGATAPIFDGPSTNRAPLAVSFEEISSGEVFTLAINHLKSKGGNGSGDNADRQDGQGNFNGTRLRGAQALAAWLANDPTGSGDPDVLIVGDLNAYAQEDPVVFSAEAGYRDLATQFLGDRAYSFVFDGQLGTLDYALANPTLQPQITGVAEWHINADEPDALDYNLDFNRDRTLFDGQTPYRTADHDPVVVGLDLGGKDN